VLRLSLSIPMVPTSKARPRVTANGTYTPKRTRVAEKTVRDYAFEAMHPRRAVAAPLALSVRALFAIPKSWSKAKREAAYEKRLMHTSKPDVDNLVKLVKDALQGVVYVDDCQIVTLTAHKDWGGVDRLEIEVTEIPTKLSKGVLFIQPKRST
jgi:Holliday junction resolvase RusA-like endonuclease